MTTITQQSATTGQIKQINRFGSDAIEKVLGELGLDNPGAQRVIEHGDEFAEAIRIAALASLKDLSVSDKFKNEEVASNYGYLSGYRKPKSITEQCNILRQIFPGVGFADEKLAERAVPANAEGWFAIPKWQTIAPTYSEAVQKVLDAVKKARNGKFQNYRDGQINGERLRKSAKTASVFQKLGDEQKNHDILVVTAQFDIRHRGRSVRRAREVFSQNEMGLVVKKVRNGKFQNYRDGQINGERLRQSAKTASVFQKLGDEQKDHDILVVAAQFGIRHRGRSVRRAREVFSQNEMGLGAFAVGIMILTHAERLQHYDDLWIDCAGDEFDVPGADVRFDFAPIFRFSDGEVMFDAHWYDYAHEYYGSVSAFVPQS
jgi:hypothetical protein